MNIETGVMISFIFCFMALFINDIGSIESMNALLKPEDRGGRVKRGILISGLSNVASGLLGVIGPVNYSLSPGVITATGCASRITMFPAALLLLILSFSPDALGIISNIPAVVIGGILIYILSMQISAGLVMTFESPDGFTVTDGLIIGLPLLLSTIIAFLPAAVLETFPALLRPIIGNGFVVGVVAALIMEHGLYRVR
jgi:xanthine/uracil permease